MISLLIGAATPYYFSSLAIRATGKSAYAMIKEIKRQFVKDPGILKGILFIKFTKSPGAFINWEYPKGIYLYIYLNTDPHYGRY